MASKMPAAIDSKSKEVTISIAERLDYTSPLECEFCNAKVSFVNGFTREVGDNIVFVNPYFRLKTGNAHGPECRYNIKGQVKIIARESDENFLAQTESGKFELRLLAVKKAIKELQNLAREKRKRGPYNQKENEDKEYVKSGKKLGSYINSAVKVLRVRSLCEEDKDIENLLELVFDGTRLPWKDFYYEDKDFFRCYSNVREATVSVPVAIVGTVKSVKIIDGKNGQFLVINLIGPYKKNEEGILDAVNVSIWSSDVELFNSYKADDMLLAFGIFEAKEISEKEINSSVSSVKKFRNHDLRLWLVSKSQLCKVNG
ncbi:hypothetical protein [Kushneria indalinina]|uniref:Uncharacterized protein n=1 Tax=Kushneria indalinina DSM 14324 TaxID=1122140 RepID=A0A3D9DT36_9GAMM|nr:hypothetical protein [Kushneria indalinina]REC93589.1 hypothetical protein C8D72_2936 [Kushneria indalinina DSM 14324]